MKKTIILIFLVLAIISAYGQAYEFRYNGAADVIFSYPPHGSGGRAFVHEGNNWLTINYGGDFSGGVKVGNYLWIANDGTLNTLGNVGIGTASVENTEGWNKVLQVHGSGHAKALVTTNNIQTGIWTHDFGIYGAPIGGVVGTRTNHPFSVVTNSSSKLTILEGGNVGIGTTTPKAKLSVNGNILATEIKIKTNIEVPDYVFDPSYQLPELSTIENYVKAHRHLPEIPSAAEIQKEGVDLTQMNLSLLKKVEELTLHLIEKEKEIEKLKRNQEAGFLELSKRLDKIER